MKQDDDDDDDDGDEDDDVLASGLQRFMELTNLISQFLSPLQSSHAEHAAVHVQFSVVCSPCPIVTCCATAAYRGVFDVRIK